MRKYIKNITSITLLLVFICTAMLSILVKMKVNHSQVIGYSQHDQNVNVLFYFLADEDDRIETYSLPSTLIPAVIPGNTFIVEILPQFIIYPNTNLDKPKHKSSIFIKLRKLRL